MVVTSLRDSMKHYRAVVGIAVDLSVQNEITELELKVEVQEARGAFTAMVCDDQVTDLSYQQFLPLGGVSAPCFPHLFCC